MRYVAIWLDYGSNEELLIQEYFPTLGDYFYYCFDAVLFGLVGLFIFSKSKKSVMSLFSLLYILGLASCQILDEVMGVINYDAQEISSYITKGEYKTAQPIFIYMPILLKVWIMMELYIAIFKRRYDWKRLTSVPYDAQKVQAIYSKPNSILSLIGVAGSLNPKLNVRFSYQDKTIRFKRNSPFPIMVDTIIQEGDVIENTNYTGDYFHNRWDYVKVKRYNLFTFNCRSLLTNRAKWKYYFKIKCKAISRWHG